MKPMTNVKPAYTISLEGAYMRDQSVAASGTFSYARELRALGQALENQGLVSLELQAKDGGYLVRGLTPLPEEPKSYLWGRLENVFASVLWTEGSSMRMDEVVYQFPPERIQQLEREGGRKRVNPQQTPDPSKLSQLLRTAGCYLDRKQQVSFLAISLKDRWVTVSYKTADGRIEQTKAELGFFYDYWVKLYLRRRNRVYAATPKMAVGPGIIIN